MTGYKFIEHTADIGIEVKAASLRELFTLAAEGLFDLITESPLSGGGSSRKISLDADSKEQLLVKWLEELLYLFEIKKLLPAAYNIGNVSDTRLEADVICFPFDAVLHRPRYEIKAVTYHNLAIKKEEGGYSVRIIFDI